MDFSGRNILATLTNIAISYDRLDNINFFFRHTQPDVVEQNNSEKIYRFDGNSIITSVCLPFQMKFGQHQGKKDDILCLIFVD